MSEKLFKVNQRKVRTSIAINKEDYEFLKAYAETQGLSLADVCRLIIKNYLKEKRKVEEKRA